MSLEVRYLDDVGHEAWDSYVQQSPTSTFFHKAGWRTVLKRAFGHIPYFLYAVDGEQLRGILPLAHIKSLLFGNSLSSLPFCVYGGVDAVDGAAQQALLEEACRLAEKLRVGALELRNLRHSDTGWPCKELYCTFRRELDADHDANMKAIPKRQRAMVRKGINAGLEGEESDDAARLYRIYSESVRNLGTPVFSGRYFEVLQEEFGEDCRILMIKKDDVDVAGVMSFYFKDDVLPYYGGSTAASRAIKGVNDFMYWDLMCRSADEGYRCFDFGRSKQGTGPFSFKKNWGFEPQQLYYEYRLVKDSEMPDINPLNPKYRFMVQTWKRLPLPLANLMGPPLARHLG